MENQVALKVTLPERAGQASVTRKILHPRHPPPTWRGLKKVIKDRFSLSEDFSLTWVDSDGDIITLSSEEELEELFTSLDGSSRILRFQIILHDSRDRATSSSSYAPSVADSDLLSTHSESSLDVPVLAFSRLSTEAPASETGSDIKYDARSVADSDGTDVPDLGLDKGKGRAVDSLTDEELSWAHVDVEDYASPSPSQEIEQKDEATMEIERSVTPVAGIAEVELERSPSPTPTVVAETDAPSDSQDPPETPAQASDASRREGLTALSSLLSTLPMHAEQFATHFSPLFQNPTHEHLSTLLHSAPRDIPNLAREVLEGVNLALAEAVERFRSEASGLRREFGEVTRELERMRRERREAEAASNASADVDEKEKKEEDRRRVKQERTEKLKASLAKSKAKKQAQAEKEQIKSQIEEDLAMVADYPSATTATATVNATSPFDDVYSINPEQPHEPQTGRSPRKARDHGACSPRRRPRSLRSLPLEVEDPSVVETNTIPPPPTNVNANRSLSDDFFQRRVGMGMPGAFSFATPHQPAPTPVIVSPRVQDPAPATSSSRASIGTYPTLPRMPGAFAFDEPRASTSRDRIEQPWAEVTPAKLGKAIKELGFDMSDLGVQVAVERTWEEMRGRKLEEMVEGVVDKIVA